MRDSPGEQERAGAKLLAWRRKRRLTQKGVAEAAGIAQAQWSLIENGERSPTLRQAFRIQCVTGGHLKARDWVPERDLDVASMARTGS